MSKGTILSVDDDKGLQTVLGQYLEGEGYSVEKVNNGADMPQKLEDTNPDVVLLDLVLPDSDGITLLSQIRSKSKVPVIVLSGKSDTTEKIICLEMGADDYITKPFEMRELSARIKAATRRTEAATPAPQITPENITEKKEIIAFDTFTLDRNQFQLFDANNKSMDITTGEFQLLEALALAPNRALSREQLFERTREGKFDMYDRAIDIQIGRIRKKLGNDGINIIKTVRGIGYMFCPP